MWRGRNCSKAVKDAHAGAVEVLSFGLVARAGVVASGGRDAKVKLWSSVDLTPLATLDVMATPSVAGLRQVKWRGKVLGRIFVVHVGHINCFL